MIEFENIKICFSNEVLKIKVYGEIDHHNAKKIREKIDSEILKNNPTKVILDLSMISFMDSSGLGLIMGRYSLSYDMGAEFILYNPNHRIRKLLELSGIERIIKIKEDDYAL